MHGEFREGPEAQNGGNVFTEPIRLLEFHLSLDAWPADESPVDGPNARLVTAITMQRGVVLKAPSHACAFEVVIPFQTLGTAWIGLWPSWVYSLL